MIPRKNTPRQPTGPTMNGTIAAARMKPAYQPLWKRPVHFGRCSSENASATPVPPMNHSAPEPESGHEPRGRELRDVLRQARGQRSDRIQPDRDPECLEPADAVGQQPDEERAAPTGQEDREEGQAPVRRVLGRYSARGQDHLQRGHEHERVDRRVEAVEHPPEVARPEDVLLGRLDDVGADLAVGPAGGAIAQRGIRLSGADAPTRPLPQLLCRCHCLSLPRSGLGSTACVSLPTLRGQVTRFSCGPRRTRNPTVAMVVFLPDRVGRWRAGTTPKTPRRAGGAGATEA